MSGSSEEAVKLKDVLRKLVACWDKVPSAEPVPEDLNDPDLWDRARRLSQGGTPSSEVTVSVPTKLLRLLVSAGRFRSSLSLDESRALADLTQLLKEHGS